MMTLEKWLKIEALMKSPASTENEKAICKRILKKNPKPEPPRPAPDPRFVDSYPGTAAAWNSAEWDRYKARAQAQPQPRASYNVNKDLWESSFDGQEKRRPYSPAEDERAQRQADVAKAQRQAYEAAENIRGQRQPFRSQGWGQFPTRMAQERWDIYQNHLKKNKIPLFDPSTLYAPPVEKKKKNFIDELARMFKKGKKGK
jgi:hypothetical protein